MAQKKQSSPFLFSKSGLCGGFLFFVCPIMAVCLVCPICVPLSALILCLFVPSEHHGQLIQLLPETRELFAAARVLATAAETQVRAGTSPWPPRPLPALRPLLLGPGETMCVTRELRNRGAYYEEEVRHLWAFFAVRKTPRPHQKRWVMMREPRFSASGSVRVPI